MKTINFKNNREEVISVLTNNEVININPEYLKEAQSWENSFNAALVVDENDNLLDYKIFDPFKTVFTGYTNPSGWSNWELCYFDDMEAFIEAYNPTDEELEMIEEIDNY